MKTIFFAQGEDGVPGTPGENGPQGYVVSILYFFDYCGYLNDNVMAFSLLKS